jgi:hypothetical protein
VGFVIQTTETQTIPQQIATAHWRILLPVIMTTSSALLMLWAKQQQPTLRKMDTGWEVPARVINSLINGPGFYLGRLIPIPIPEALNEGLSYDADKISGIALFWFLVGLSIDRRSSKQGLDRRHPIRAGVLFTFAALVCGLLGFGRIAATLCPSPNLACWDQRLLWLPLRVVADHPLRTWTAMDLGLAVWLFAFSIYFTRRAFIAARRSLVKTT